MSATIIIIIATVAASFYAWNNEDIYRKWLMNPYYVSQKGQYYRFLTSGLIHADHAHLFVNMLSFYFFGRVLENFLQHLFGFEGSLVLLVFYILGIIVSEIPTYFKHKKDHWYNSLGASGAVSAVIFSFIVIAPTADIQLFFFIDIPAIVFGVLYLIYTYYSSQRSATTINHDAHFYGALFGIAFILFIEPSLIHSFVYQIQNWKPLK